MNPATIIRVTEDRSVEAALSPEAVGDLLRSPNPLFEIRPATTPGRFQIIAGSRIGIWETASLRVHVESKIRGVNLLAMIDPESPIHSRGNESEQGLEETFLATLAARLGRLMTAHARRGLRLGYAPIKEEVPFLRGKLDLPAQMRDQCPGTNTFHVEHELFTCDTLANQIPKTVAERLAVRFSASSDAGRSLTEGINGYAAVPADGVDMRRVFDEPSLVSPDNGEQELIDLSRLIWEGFDPRETNEHQHPSLQMLDLHQVFERYVAAGLARGLPDIDVNVQRVIVMGKNEADRLSNLTARPDLMISRAGHPGCVIDTKWKLFNGLPAADDLQQIIAYLHVTESRFGMLVYPGNACKFKEFAIPGGGEIILQQVNVTGTCGECRESLSQLADEIRSRL